MIHFGNLYAALDGKGKVFWADKTAMANCVNCGSTPSEMAKRDGNFRLDPSTLQYGMAAMHCRNRTFEWLCKGFLYSDLETWYLPALWQFLKDEKMVEMQAAFKERLGLNVYKVLPGKCGNSNSGNTSRKAFENADVFADIINVPADIVEDLGTLINAANCKHALSASKVEKLSTSVLDRIHDYGLSWNWLSQSVHTLLHHFHQFVAFYPTPPGYWTEEGAEVDSIKILIILTITIYIMTRFD